MRHIFLVTFLILNVNTNAQVGSVNNSGCAIRYSYDNNGNRTVREWYCWNDPINNKPGNNPGREASIALSDQGITIKVFPNPTINQFTVLSDSSIRNGYLLLFDAAGKKVKYATFNGLSEIVSVSDLSKGVYNLVLLIGSKRYSMVKIIKE